MRILAVGDVCGPGGLEILERKLRGIKRLEEIDFVVVNGENASGRGLTPKQAQAMLDAGADAITLGNHSFDQRSICDFLDDGAPIVRPLNLAPQLPGQGVYRTDWNGVEICLVNLLGRLNLDFRAADPFEAADRLLKEQKAAITLVDFHAEATSEKRPWAIFWTAGFRRSTAPTPMCRRRTSISCPRARAISPTWA